MPSVFCGSPGVLFPRRRLVPGGYLDRRGGCEAEREECWFSRKVSRGWVPVPLAQPRLPTRLPEVYYRGAVRPRTFAQLANRARALQGVLAGIDAVVAARVLFYFTVPSQSFSRHNVHCRRRNGEYKPRQPARHMNWAAPVEDCIKIPLTSLIRQVIKVLHRPVNNARIEVFHTREMPRLWS